MKKLAILWICAGIVLAFKPDDKGRMCLKYDRPAEFFEEALPLGNGRLGAMVYGGTSVDRISLNDITLWTGEPDRGAEHPDYSLVETLTPWGESAEWMDDVRAALDNEDYEGLEDGVFDDDDDDVPSAPKGASPLNFFS